MTHTRMLHESNLMTLTAETTTDIFPVNGPLPATPNTSEQVEIDPSQADMFDDAQTTIIGDETNTSEPFLVGAGSLIPIIATSETGVDPTLLEKPIIDSIFQQLVLGGRDCEAEYAQQVAGLTEVLGPAIQGGLEGALASEE